MKNKKVFVLEFKVFVSYDLSDCSRHDGEDVGKIYFRHWQVIATGSQKALEKRAKEVIEANNMISAKRTKKSSEREECKNRSDKPYFSKDDEQDEGLDFKFNYPEGVSKTIHSTYRIRQMPFLE